VQNAADDGKRGASMKKVLLTEDLKNLMSKKSSFLDRADIKVFAASTNGELLKTHREIRADLIVSELDLPGVKSEKIFGLIRQNTELRAVSVIIVCADTLANRERCKRCGANEVFPLPVDTPELHLKMQQLLNIAPRMFYRVGLAVAIQGKFKDRPLPFWTENISASGILIRAQEPLSRGEGIFFSFFLPEGTHVSGYGEIARVGRTADARGAFLYGIKFTNVAPDVISAIEAAIRK
jgi:CheY-like chemotaxis protein